MAFGLTVDGFVAKRLADIKAELEQRFRDEFGDEIDLRPQTPEGLIIGIMSEREAAIWELAQAVYDSKNPTKSTGKSLDDVTAITGTTRSPARVSSVSSGVARGDNGTVLDISLGEIIISVAGDTAARFRVIEGPYIINIPDGPTFKSGPIKLVSETTGEIVANAGTLTVIETPLAGLNSFTNEIDAVLGAPIMTDSELKLKRKQELQLAGSSTIGAIYSRLNARPLVEKVIVFQNNTSIIDLENRPPKSLDIVVLGDNEDDLAQAIFEVVGGGVQTIGDISRQIEDQEGFEHTIKFSRPTEVPIWIEMDITKNVNLYPVDGDIQIRDAILAYGELQEPNQNVIVKGSNSLINVLNDITGITDVEIRIGKLENPLTDDNVAIAAREVAVFDSVRILIDSD